MTTTLNVDVIQDGSITIEKLETNLQNTISVNTSKLTDELSSIFLKSEDLHTASDDDIKAFLTNCYI